MSLAEKHAKSWQIDLFGRLTLRDPEGNIRVLASRKSAELLAYLALRKNPSVSRDAVAEALWPETDIFTGRNRLKATLSNLNREIEGLPLLTHGKHYLELDRSAVVIDLEQCERRLRWRNSVLGRNRASFAKQLLEKLNEKLLPELAAPWVVHDRDRYAAIAVELRRDVEEAGAEVEARFRLDDQLGGVELDLVGREAELEGLNRWIRETGTRELHIIGTPGVGKTRLLREMVRLAGPVCDASIVLSTVQSSEVPWLDRLGQTLGLHNSEDVTRSLIQLLADFRQPILFLDDIDQALPEMQEWIERIMAAVPQLRVLATARRRPDNPEISVCRLEPFGGQHGDSDSGVALLSAFARRFGLHDRTIQDSEDVLAEIAQRLEGLPLALEIAAAWLPILEPRAFKRRLDSSSDLITRQPGAGRSSLVDCVSAIMEELSPTEQHAFLVLSVCRGGCGQALAEEILGSEWVWPIRTLVDRSLALRVEGEVENRFLVVHALREAVRVLETPERIKVAEMAWQTGCLALGDRAYLEVNERDRKHWLSWLRDEGDNIVAACDLCGSGDQLGQAIDLLDRLSPAFWLINQTNHLWTAFQRLLELGKARFSKRDGEAPLAVVESRVAELTRNGDLGAAIQLAASHRQGLETAGDALQLALALDNEGDVRVLAEDFQGAMDCWNRCSLLFEGAGYPRHALWLESKLIKAELSLNRFSAAEARRARSLERARLLEDYNSVGVYLKMYATKALENRQFGEAIQLAEGSVEAFKNSGEVVTLGQAFLVLAGTHLVNGNVASAARALQDAQHVLTEPNEEQRERLDVLAQLVSRRADGRLYYDHVFAEH